MTAPRIGVVVLTQGRRPDDLRRAFESLLAQQGVELDVVCVGNGWEPVDLPDGVRPVHLEENVGIPAGRNAGAAHVGGELLFFLDDDAQLAGTGDLAAMAARFARHPHLGLLQARVETTDGSAAPQRWVPRMGSPDPRRSGPVFSVWEGALLARRAAFDAAGGWADPFFYAHEGIELAWRVWDAGYVVWYAGDLRVLHPPVDPRRHSQYLRLNARNRVWLARRNLPVVLRPLYVGTWTAVQLVRGARGRDREGTRQWWRGFREGFAVDPGGVRTMSWRTVARMSRYGRPPVV
jgi:GT2 family glycosyltransferase